MSSKESGSKFLLGTPTFDLVQIEGKVVFGDDGRKAACAGKRGCFQCGQCTVVKGLERLAGIGDIRHGQLYAVVNTKKHEVMWPFSSVISVSVKPERIIRARQQYIPEAVWLAGAAVDHLDAFIADDLAKGEGDF